MTKEKAAKTEGPAKAETEEKVEKLDMGEQEKVVPVIIEVKEDVGREPTREEARRDEEVSKWVPKTKLGKLVKEKKITDIDPVLVEYKILEKEIVDSLLDLKSDLLSIGQAKGKFGGGKRRAWRQTQRKTAEGNVPTFACMVVVGDEAGHIGIGVGKAKETLPAREKANRNAKLNILKINRGCGSFDCSCKEEHSVPFQVSGKCGSCKITLIPAPQGTGLVAGDECKKVLRLAGIKDIYVKSFGQKRTTVNLIKACVEALKKTTEFVEVKK